MRSARRTAVAILSAVALMMAGACGGDSGSSDLEVFTWWSEGGEKAGLDQLVKTFEKACPDTSFVNGVVSGGAGANAKQILASRLQTGDPPDTFQAHAGAELADYIGAGQIENLSTLYRQWRLVDAFPQGLIDSLTVQGAIFSVPVNIHRTNIVWANRKVLASAGITGTPQTMEEFFAALDKLRSKGMTDPLALGKDWTQTMVFEAVLVSNLGPDRFTKLFSNGTGWDGPAVTKSINDYKRLLSYANDDRDNLDWNNATSLLVEGKAAFQVMGDWATASFDASGFGDYDHFVFPGNGNTFQWLADSFVLPTGARNARGTRCWLKAVGSKDGQKAFNTKKGSIPARLDADPADYPAYQQSAMADWKRSKQIPSCAHGAACSQGLQVTINSAIVRFAHDGDTATFQKTLVTAVTQYLSR